MKTELINIQKHIIAFLIFAFFNSMMLIFSFSYTYLHGFIYAGENAVFRMFILVLPHIALLALNLWLVAWLYEKLKLNKVFQKLMQSIAIFIFAIAFIILSLDVYIAYTSKGFIFYS